MTVTLLLSLAALLTPDPTERLYTPATHPAGDASIEVPQLLQLGGADKPRHAAMSFAIVLFANAGATFAGFDADASLLVGVSASAAAGIGKELYDRARGGAVDPADLVWNALGIAAGWLLANQTR